MSDDPKTYIEENMSHSLDVREKEAKQLLRRNDLVLIKSPFHGTFKPKVGLVWTETGGNHSIVYVNIVKPGGEIASGLTGYHRDFIVEWSTTPSDLLHKALKYIRFTESE